MILMTTRQGDTASTGIVWRMKEPIRRLTSRHESRKNRSLHWEMRAWSIVYGQSSGIASVPRASMIHRSQSSPVRDINAMGFRSPPIPPLVMTKPSSGQSCSCSCFGVYLCSGLSTVPIRFGPSSLRPLSSASTHSRESHHFASQFLLRFASTTCLNGMGLRGRRKSTFYGSVSDRDIITEQWLHFRCAQAMTHHFRCFQERTKPIDGFPVSSGAERTPLSRADLLNQSTQQPIIAVDDHEAKCYWPCHSSRFQKQRA